MCVCSKQKLGQEQAKYTHNAKSAQEPGSQLELCGSSATPRLCIVYLYIHVLYVIGSKEDDLPVSRSMYYIFPYFPSPFSYIFTSLTQCCHLSKEDRRNCAFPPSLVEQLGSMSASFPARHNVTGVVSSFMTIKPAGDKCQSDS